MHQSDIKQHSVYTTKVSGRVVPLRVDLITKRARWQYCSRDPLKGKTVMATTYECTNLTTGRTITVKSAQRFRHLAGERIMTHLGLPSTLLPAAQQTSAAPSPP